jgi:hypothetical protein
MPLGDVKVKIMLKKFLTKFTSSKERQILGITADILTVTPHLLSILLKLLLMLSQYLPIAEPPKPKQNLHEKPEVTQNERIINEETEISEIILEKNIDKRFEKE